MKRYDVVVEIKGLRRLHLDRIADLSRQEARDIQEIYAAHPNVKSAHIREAIK